MNNDTKSKLLATALELFAEFGYDKVSIRAITNAANVNSSLISYHFNGKQGLYRAIFQQQMGMAADFMAMRAAEHSSPEEIIRAYANTVYLIHTKSPAFIKIIARELLTPSVTFKQVIQEQTLPIFNILRQAIDEGVRTRRFAPAIDTSQAVLQLVSIVNFYFMTKTINHKIVGLADQSTRAYIEQGVDIFLRGLARSDKNV